MVWFNSVLNSTNKKIGAKQTLLEYHILEEIKRGVLSATASGHRLSTFIIFKKRNGVIPHEVFSDLVIPHNVCLTTSLNLMDDDGKNVRMG